MDNFIDFSDCNVLSYNYGGKSRKAIVKYKEDLYILKFEEHPRKKAALLPYTNSWLSEYVGCHFIETLDIPVQETVLGTCNGYNVVACKDFTYDINKPSLYLHEFSNVDSTTVEIKRNSLEIDNILSTIEFQKGIDPAIVKERFWEQFVIDGYIGNYDRHNSNWGFLIDKMSNEVSLAPIYDCGAGLYPLLSDEEVHSFLSNPKTLAPIVKNEPSSVYRDNGVKLNYYNYLTSTKNPDLINAVKKIVPKFNQESINSIIDSIPVISNTRKEFYKTIFEKKHELILLPAYRKILKQEKKLSKGRSI